MQNVSTNLNATNNSYFDFKSKYSSNIDLYINCIYLSITTITTIGYGENISNYAYGKLLIAIEAMIGQIMWGLSMTLWFVGKNIEE